MGEGATRTVKREEGEEGQKMKTHLHLRLQFEIDVYTITPSTIATHILTVI